jgi:hypothetical protein
MSTIKTAYNTLEHLLEIFHLIKIRNFTQRDFNWFSEQTKIKSDIGLVFITIKQMFT